MKILYFYQYFSTPEGSWGTRVYDFAKDWVEKGHKVTVVTSIYSKSDLTANKFIEHKNIEGIDVIVLNIKIDNKQHPIKRIWTFLQYSILSSLYALKSRDDVVVASSGPITVGLPGLISKLIKRKKLVFEVRDLWPDTAIEMGFVNSRFLKKLMYSFEKFCYDRSDLIVTLSPGSRENIIHRYHKDYNCISVTNSANIELFQQNGENTLSSFGLEKHEYAVYTGNIGEVNNSKLLLETARILKQREITGLKIVLVGDGQQKKELKERAVELELADYFEIKDLMPKHRLVPIIKHSLASLIPLANKPLLDTSSPNKLFESFAAGVPVIQTTNGWIKELLENEKCGLTVDSTKPNEMAEALLKLKTNPKLRETMAQNSLRLATEQFRKEILSDKMLKGMESLLYKK